MTETQVSMSHEANRHRRHLVFSIGDRVLVHRDSLILSSKAGRKFTKLWLGPVRVTNVINENAYELDLHPCLRSPKQSSVFNVSSLKEFVPLSSEFESLHPMLLSDIIEQSFRITALSDVKLSDLLTRWLDSELPVRLSLPDYEQFPLATRLALENAYNDRVTSTAAFHSDPGSLTVVRRSAPARHSTLPRTARLPGLQDPPSVRGQTQIFGEENMA